MAIIQWTGDVIRCASACHADRFRSAQRFHTFYKRVRDAAVRYDANHKQATRDRMLQAAAQQIRERGPHGIALASVMRDAGLTHGGFYAHFGSKDAFVLAAVEQMFDDSPVDILRGAQDQCAEDTLNAFIDFYLSPDHRDMRTASCPLPFLTGDSPRLGDDIRKRLSQGIEGMVRLVRGHLERLGRHDPESDANTALAQMIGAVILARTLQSRKHSDALLKQTRAAVRRQFGLEA
ncbi:TetR/AcrR family transcriptional regulator [Chitinasiproducens palmae]|nr:TetR/AcrR family transcriptional regulator [Chitinasiproducens palmae]